MALSKIDSLAQGVTLAMVAALKEYAQEAQAGSFSDGELFDLLARYGGSMVLALAYLQAQGERRRGIFRK
jgi:hypothetical protein